MNNSITTTHRYLCLGLITFSYGLLLANRVAGGEGEFTIEARDFDSGNARVSLTGEAYADAHSCIWNAGELPNWVEYEINFPLAAEYAIWALYAAERHVRSRFAWTGSSWNRRSAAQPEHGTLPRRNGSSSAPPELRKVRTRFACTVKAHFPTSARYGSRVQRHFRLPGNSFA